MPCLDEGQRLHHHIIHIGFGWTIASGKGLTIAQRMLCAVLGERQSLGGRYQTHSFGTDEDLEDKQQEKARWKLNFFWSTVISTADPNALNRSVN
jgi:hypothetical protein